MVGVIKANETTQLALLSQEEAEDGWVKRSRSGIKFIGNEPNLSRRHRGRGWKKREGTTGLNKT